MTAPADKNSKVYKLMSIRLQQRFKQLIHDIYFRNLDRYGAPDAAYPILCFCSMEPCADIKLLGGQTFTLLGEDADGDKIHWDITEVGQNQPFVDLRLATLSPSSAQSRLQTLLALARERLTVAGRQHDVGFYSGQAAGEIVRETLNDSMKSTLLKSLLIEESSLVEQARTAGLKMAAFNRNSFSNPEQARKDLAEFGLKLSEDFNKNLNNVAVGNDLLPLGTAIYCAAAEAIDPTVKSATTAMFTVQVLKPGVATLTPADTDVLATQRVVHAV